MSYEAFLIEPNACYDLMCSASHLLMSSIPGSQLYGIRSKLKQYLHSHCSLCSLNVTSPLNIFRLYILLLLLYIIVPLLEVEGAAIKRRGGLYKGKKRFRCVKTPTEFIHKDFLYNKNLVL